jgi:hypothetical protein
MAQQPLMGQGLLIIKASQSQSDTSHLVWFLWASDGPVTVISTWRHITLTGYKTHALDCMATGIGICVI